MEDFLKKQISENYEQILDRVASAALKSGRKPDQICVVVVTKAHSIETVKAVVDSGIEKIGDHSCHNGRHSWYIGYELRRLVGMFHSLFILPKQIAQDQFVQIEAMKGIVLTCLL